MKTVGVGLTFHSFVGATFTYFVGPTVFGSQQIKTVGVGGNYGNILGKKSPFHVEEALFPFVGQKCCNTTMLLLLLLV